MSSPSEPGPAKLVVGAFTPDKGLFPQLAEELADRFGQPDLVSPWFDFTHTRYYEQEMGTPLFRRMLAFSQLIPMEELGSIKLFTNRMEARYQEDGRRRVNIDPGYLTLERFVLASGKNFTHRIYIGKGVFADLTLVYHKKDFTPLPWTYPDYAGEEIRTFLGRVRQRYLVAVHPRQLE